MNPVLTKGIDHGTYFMIQEKTDHFPLEILRQELAAFRMTTSPITPNFSLNKMLAEVTSCRIIKENERRRIFYLQTPMNGFFLKLSMLVRRKDRWRHFFLPFRKWAEWRNLHRLFNARIPAATPILRGEYKASHPKMFLLLTEEVKGFPFQINTAADARKMGEYAAGLHSNGVYHTDLHPNNIILTPEGQARLIDVQQVFFLPWIPRRLRVHNLGKIYFNLCACNDTRRTQQFLAGYNHNTATHIRLADFENAVGHHQKRKFSSRSKRCTKNSTEFAVIKGPDWKGYKRKTFHWGAQDLRQALKNGQPLKGTHVISYKGVCIKKHPRRLLFGDRCLRSWKMSRALEVRGISVPRSLGYFVIDNISCFIAELIDDRLHLNVYLSSISDKQAKRLALKKLALWLRRFYDTNVWQRDFKSSNILCRDGEYFMVDLDGVRIRRLKEHHKIINLAQLNASLSNAVTLKDRLRFYHYYTAKHRPTRPQRRAVYRKVWDITRTKNTSIYNLDLAKLWIHYP